MVINTVLQSLAVADTLVLISTLFVQSFRHVGWTAYNNVYGHIFIVFYPLTYCVRLVDTWLTVLLTVNRYIAVCKPLKLHICCGSTRTWMIIAAISLAAVVFSLPRFFEFKLVDDQDRRYQFIPTSLTQDRVYTILYRTSLFLAVMYLVPMSLMMTLNVLLLAALRRSEQNRVTLRSHQASLASSRRRRRRVSVISDSLSSTKARSRHHHHLLLLFLCLCILNCFTSFYAGVTADVTSVQIKPFSAFVIDWTV